MRLTRVFAAVALALAGNLAVAGDADQSIRAALQSIQPDLPIEAIAESPMPGLYQVQLQGGRQLYASADGQFLLQGYLFQIKEGQALNLTEQEESRGVVKTLNAIPASEMVVFAGKQPKTHITVFTDTDCGYCQKLHSEVPELNRLGVEVRYLAFPRQGLNAPAAKELSNVWCAKDKQQAMNLAKTGQPVADAKCDSPVAKQYALGQMIGVSGTPAIVLANGKIIPGYQPAAQLAKIALESK